MLVDLSKAFDCLSHRLLLAKLSAYSLVNDICYLPMSYLSERKQPVKVGNARSSWSEIKKTFPRNNFRKSSKRLYLVLKLRLLIFV